MAANRIASLISRDTGGDVQMKRGNCTSCNQCPKYVQPTTGGFDCSFCGCKPAKHMALTPISSAVDIMSGWMKVRGTFQKWHNKWVILRPGRLYYYKNPQSGKPDGYLKLHGCEVVPKPSKRKSHVFKIKHLNGQIITSKNLKADNCVLRVATDQELQEWFKAIREAIKYADKYLPLPYAPPANTMTAKRGEFKSPSDDEAEGPNGSPPPHGMAPTAARNISTETRDRDDDMPDDESSGEQSSWTDETDEENDRAAGVGSGAVPSTSAGAGARGTPSPNAELQEEEKNITTYVSAKKEDVNPNEIIEEEAMPEEAKNITKILLKQLRPGMDLAKIILPTFILEPRSFLEKLTDYFTHSDLLNRAPHTEDPLQRMLAVVKWYVSGFYIRPKGVKKPYNPILGETYRCQWEYDSGAKAHFVAEQVSTLPFISCLYVTNRKDGWVVNGTIHFKSYFKGLYVIAVLTGAAAIHLTPWDESYSIGFPSSTARGFIMGTLRAELVGRVTIECTKTGYTTDLDFETKGTLWGGDYNTMRGVVRRGKETLYNITGKWTERLMLQDARTGSSELFWDATPQGLPRAPVKKEVAWDEMLDTESLKMWKDVTTAIKKNDDKLANKLVYDLEQPVRDACEERERTGEVWMPTLFHYVAEKNYEYNWYCKDKFDPAIEEGDYEADFVIHRKMKGAAAAAPKKSLAAGGRKGSLLGKKSTNSSGSSAMLEAARNTSRKSSTLAVNGKSPEPASPSTPMPSVIVSEASGDVVALKASIAALTKRIAALENPPAGGFIGIPYYFWTFLLILIVYLYFQRV